VRRPVSTHEEIRRLCGLTQAELAEKAGYARAYVARVECGDAQPSASYREAIARALNVPEKMIFGRSDKAVVRGASP
jgi:transcriptional regulator with XRE-family HTH domain